MTTQPFAGTDKIEAIVKALAALNEEMEPGLQELGGPAAPDAIDALETAAGFALPPSYRAFLVHHDGWRGFWADLDLLSSSAADRAKYRANIAETLDAHCDIDPKEKIPAEALYIAASRDAPSLIYLDPRSRRPDGELDVVRYDRDGEQSRHGSLVEMLEEQLETIRGLREE